MDARAIAERLRAEGYGHVFAWEDAPGAVYPTHSHAGETAHVVLSGEIAITTAAGTRTYRSGDRFDVPADEAHSARVGPEGCRYVVGER